MSRTKFMLLGTGTPSYLPGLAQQSSAVIVDDQAYLIDCGDGAMLRVVEAFKTHGLNAFNFTKLNRLFITHLHPDHTVGLPGLIIGSWVMRRTETLHIYGPRGTQALVDGIEAAYKGGTDAHRAGPAPLPESLGVEVHEYIEGEVYEDKRVTISAFLVDHGPLDVYAFKFVTPDKTIVHSADTCPVPALIEHARGCDLLIHEIYLEESMRTHFGPDWQNYHSSMHTSESQLATIANEVQPKLLVLNHQMLWGKHTPDDLMAELVKQYTGKVVYGRDLDLFEL